MLAILPDVPAFSSPFQYRLPGLYEIGYMSDLVQAGLVVGVRLEFNGKFSYPIDFIISNIY